MSHSESVAKQSTSKQVNTATVAMISDLPLWTS